MSKHDPIGFIETTIEYYLPGVDVSALSDDQLILKFGHLERIRNLEAKAGQQKR